MSTPQPKGHAIALASYILYSVFKEQHPTARDNHTSNCEPLNLAQFQAPKDRLTGLSGPEGVGEADAYVNRIQKKESRHFFGLFPKTSDSSARRGRQHSNGIVQGRGNIWTVVTSGGF
jgi:hypothetical protein